MKSTAKLLIVVIFSLIACEQGQCQVPEWAEGPDSFFSLSELEIKVVRYGGWSQSRPGYDVSVNGEGVVDIKMHDTAIPANANIKRRVSTDSVLDFASTLLEAHFFELPEILDGGSRVIIRPTRSEHKTIKLLWETYSDNPCVEITLRIGEHVKMVRAFYRCHFSESDNCDFAGLIEWTTRFEAHIGTQSIWEK